MERSESWKVLIAEDEPIIMRGIEAILSTNGIFPCEIVGRAYNGLEAKEWIERCKPDIVITDIKMPGMDGIELLQYIFEHHREISTVVLSGYHEYHYLRKAINYQTVDYVLKPVQPRELIESVQQAIERRASYKKEQAEKERLAMQANQWIQHVQDQQWDKWIHGEAALEEPELGALYGAVEAMHFILGLIYIKDHHASADAANVIRHAGYNDNALKVFLTRHGEIALLCFYPPGCDKEAERLLRDMKQKAEAMLQQSIVMVVSSPYSDTAHLTTAYHQCKEWSLLSYLPCRDWVAAGRERFLSSSVPLDVHMEIERVVSSIRQGSAEEAVTSMKQLLERLIQDHPHPPMLRNRLMDVFLEIWHRCKECCGEGEIAILIRLAGNPESYGSWDLLMSDARRLIRGLVKASRSYASHKRQISLAKQYIERRFAENITLKEVADHVFLSPAYFSTLFKTVTGMNFIDYVNRVRIEKSKQLLKQTNEKIYSIAEKAGYRSMQHFGKIFKEFVGMTPSDYREANFEK